MGVYQRGRKFWISYTVEGRQHREPAGYNRKHAERLLEHRQATIVLGQFKPRSKRIRLAEYEPTYLAWARAKKASWPRDQTALAHLVRHLGHLYLEDIRHSRIETYQQARLKERGRAGRHPKPATVNKEVVCLKKLLSLAVRDRVLAEHPAKGAGMLDEDNERNRIVTDAESEALLAVAPEWFRPILVLANETAMRANELALLPWAEVDLKTGLIRVRSGQTKNKTARSIPLSEHAIETLKALPRPIKGGPVFLRRGKPLRSGQAVSSAFRSVRKAASLEDIWFHDFRRTCATRWRRGRLVGYHLLELPVRPLYIVLDATANPLIVAATL